MQSVWKKKRSRKLLSKSLLAWTCAWQSADPEFVIGEESENERQFLASYRSHSDEGTQSSFRYLPCQNRGQSNHKTINSIVNLRWSRELRSQMKNITIELVSTSDSLCPTSSPSSKQTISAIRLAWWIFNLCEWLLSIVRCLLLFRLNRSWIINHRDRAQWIPADIGRIGCDNESEIIEATLFHCFFLQF